MIVPLFISPFENFIGVYCSNGNVQFEPTSVITSLDLQKIGLSEAYMIENCLFIQLFVIIIIMTI